VPELEEVDPVVRLQVGDDRIWVPVDQIAQALGLLELGEVVVRRPCPPEEVSLPLRHSALGEESTAVLEDGENLLIAPGVRTDDRYELAIELELDGATSRGLDAVYVTHSV
jgi:hypothetical protein